MEQPVQKPRGREHNALNKNIRKSGWGLLSLGGRVHGWGNVERRQESLITEVLKGHRKAWLKQTPLGLFRKRDSMVKLHACSSLTMVWRRDWRNPTVGAARREVGQWLLWSREKMLATKNQSTGKSNGKKENNILKTDSTVYKHQLDWV